MVCWLRFSIIVFERVAGALEGREAGADDGTEDHPVARLAVATCAATNSHDRALVSSSIRPTPMNVPVAVGRR